MKKDISIGIVQRTRIPTKRSTNLRCGWGRQTENNESVHYKIWTICVNKDAYGLCNAPSTIQRCMELIFRGLQWYTLLIYLDDIINFSTDYEEHLERLEEVLCRRKKLCLKLKPLICELLKSELLYLGHIVGKDGVNPNPKIIQSTKSGRHHVIRKKYNNSLVFAITTGSSSLSSVTLHHLYHNWLEKTNPSSGQMPAKSNFRNWEVR